MRTISASSFSDYLLCPSIYDYKYIQNYQDIFSAKSKDIEKGNIIHALIDADSQGIHYPETYINKDKEVKESFDYYLENYSGNKSDSHYEYTFNFSFETSIESVILTGRVDKIIFEKDNITIIDWKTTNRKTKLSLIVNQLQMEFYAYVLSKINNIDLINIKIAYLSLKSEENLVIKGSDLLLIEEKILKMIKGTNPHIKNYVLDPVELSKGRYICEICNFLNFCKEYL